MTEKMMVGVLFVPLHFHGAAANLLTNDALDPEAKISESNEFGKGWTVAIALGTIAFIGLRDSDGTPKLALEVRNRMQDC